MPLQETSGTASYDAFGGGAAVEPVYIEQIFSTWLYTGNGSTQTITNGIDLAGKGGLVWMKGRSGTQGAASHGWYDTDRGIYNEITSNSTAQQFTRTTALTAFNADGFSLGSYGGVNGGSTQYASWTFRKQPKFFDVVTWTGDAVAGRTISHSLGSVPGCIIVKCTSTTRDWAVYHTSLGATQGIYLNSSAAAFTSATALWNGTSPTSTNFTVGPNADVNGSGQTYVAYLFAHNAGGFGLTGTDNVISCGSFTLGTTTADVNLGWEPQWILFKRTNSASDWRIYDTMRGWTADGNDQRLQANVSDAEDALTSSVKVTSTGFFAQGLGTSNSYIYIAIRRGPMKTPTSGTSVFVPAAQNDSTPVTTNFPTDFFLENIRAGNASNTFAASRLTGGNNLVTSSTAAEVSGNMGSDVWTSNTKLTLGIFGASAAIYAFQRAPGFFDEVCYTGTGSATTQAHNLGVVPEMMIVKRRDSTGSFNTYHQALGPTKWIYLNFDGTPVATSGVWNDTAPTASVFTVGTSSQVNASGSTYVNYLFASCPGVSKVGSYTGNGTTQTINCGFTGGARFVLIKRTDSTGDWYVYDTARGMTTLTDPYLLLNSTAAESATLGSVTSVTGGFALNASILAAINTNAASYIFLAIA